MSRDDAILLDCRSEAGPGQRRDEPVTCGVPWPRGVLLDPAALGLLDAGGAPVALQTRVLDRWPDGSVRWLLVDWLARAAPEGRYRLVTGTGSPPPTSPLTVDRTAARAGLEVRTGPLVARLGSGSAFPFAAAEFDGRPALDPMRTGFTAEDGSGRSFGLTVDRVELEEEGSVRACVLLEGRLEGAGVGALLEARARLHFFAGSATVSCELTLRNSRAAGHPGGHWGLGEKGSVHLRDAALALALPAAAGRAVCRVSVAPGEPFREVAAPVEIYQDSSGGESWRSPNHVDRHGRLPLRFRGYRLRQGGEEIRGLRATPIVALTGEGAEIALSVPGFWQNFPRALEAEGGRLALRLFPRQSAGLHELQGGEQKTHLFHLALGRDRVSEPPLAWSRAPLLVRADPEWYAASGAIPRLVARERDPNHLYLELVDLAIEGDESFEAKRERIDEYGWRHFGDMWADHETVFNRGPGPRASHYNNQFDAVAGAAIQFLRSGDGRWQRMMDELARHVVDIDTYHTDADRAAYNGGQFWHTVHYTDAGTSNHRSFPRAEGVAGGGPSPGQLYTTGLMLHYFLTGCADSRETAIGYGRYVIDCDDGRLSRFRLLDRGRTGHASESGFDRYHGPGRTSANSLNALLDAYRLSADRRFIEKAEELIRRSIHPRDDLAARNLLDAENRWYYTMFLQSLGRYLTERSAAGRRHRMYAYAREALLHYARWALEREYPYLDKPEILEFPTETWAAQDLRKSEVFNLAALLCEGEERRRFLERGRFFFDRSLETLRDMETRSLCRPLAILMSNGVSQAYFDAAPGESLPPPDPPVTDFGEPEVFVPQRVRVVRKLALLAALGGLAILALAVWAAS